jgi:hypothetical protein
MKAATAAVAVAAVAVMEPEDGLSAAFEEAAPVSFVDPLPRVPAIFKQAPNWVRWKLEKDADGKDTKKPYQINGYLASSTDPTTWTDYRTAVTGRTIDSTQGVGFALTKELGIVGFDLDGCRNSVTGEITVWAKRIIDALASYTEITPSGTGVRVFVVGKKPDGKFKFQLALSAGFGSKVQIEVYDTARYYTVTGDCIGGVEVAERDVEDTYKLCYEIMHEHPTEKVQKDATSTLDDSPSVQIKSSGLVVTTKLALLMHGEIVNRSPFTVSMQGNSIEYPSQSEADLALATMLAIKHNGDADLIDAEFRESALCRKKWERQDYRNGTIKRAIASAARLPQGVVIPNETQSTSAQAQADAATAASAGVVGEFPFVDEIPDFDDSVITGTFKKLVDAICLGTTIPRQYGLQVVKMLACIILTKRKVKFDDCESARSYFITFGDTGTGKGLIWRRLEQILKCFTEELVHVTTEMDSGAGLRDLFFTIPEDKNRPVLYFVDEVKTLGHKADGRKNPEIIDSIIEMANSTTVSRTKAVQGKKLPKSRPDSWLFLYACAQDGEAYGTAFPKTKSQGLPDRFIPEYSSKVKAGRLPEPDFELGMEAIMELLGQCPTKFTMSPDVSEGVDKVWDSQPDEVQKSPRLRQQFLLEMYLAAFSRGSKVAEQQDLAIAVKALDRQKAIRAKVFAEEMPNQVGVYASRLKTINKDMQHRLRKGCKIPTVALSLRDLMTQTMAYKENDLPSFNQAWKAAATFWLECKVTGTNGHIYKKYVPMPEETDGWLSAELMGGKAIG